MPIAYDADAAERAWQTTLALYDEIFGQSGEKQPQCRGPEQVAAA